MPGTLATRAAEALAPVIRSAIGLAVLAVVPLFLVFANDQLKELLDRFVGGCVLVVDKRVSKAGQVLVTAQIAGEMPKGVPLTFEGRDALINTILFDEPYRQEAILEPDDLAFHPMTGQSCPGELCVDSGSAALRRQVQFVMRDLRPEFGYRFRIRLRPEGDDPKKPVTVQNLKVFAVFDKGLADGVCRVQPRRWFNFWVWATPLQKALLFIGMVVSGGLLLQWARSKGASS